MRLDDQVTVTCTDTDKAMPGTVVRMRGEWVDVEVGELLISLRRAKPGLWVGSKAGMEFVINDAA
ncbi:MAG: hypothetical protein O3B74_04550 [Proteobacteria bacterium]|nr:hypothetical protein [Pseudomonadota bacterium]